MIDILNKFHTTNGKAVATQQTPNPNTNLLIAIEAVELAWLRQVLYDLGVFLPSPPTIWCDKTFANALVSNRLS